MLKPVFLQMMSSQSQPNKNTFSHQRNDSTRNTKRSSLHRHHLHHVSTSLPFNAEKISLLKQTMTISTVVTFSSPVLVTIKEKVSVFAPSWFDPRFRHWLYFAMWLKPEKKNDMQIIEVFFDHGSRHVTSY